MSSGQVKEMDALQQQLGVAEEGAEQLNSKVAAVQKQLDTSVVETEALQQQVWSHHLAQHTKQLNNLLTEMHVFACYFSSAGPHHGWLSNKYLKILMLPMSNKTTESFRGYLKIQRTRFLPSMSFDCGATGPAQQAKHGSAEAGSGAGSLESGSHPAAAAE